MYSLDLGGSRFSPLADITPRNVGRLAEVWATPVARALDEDSDAPGGRGNPQATPIAVDGVLYLPVRGNEVVALEAHTGQEIWRHTLRAPLSTTARGVAYWPGDGTLPPRILLTAGPTLVALDARTGRPVPEFGTDGVVQIAVPWNGVPVDLSRPRDLGCDDERDRSRRARRHARVRRPHGQAALDVPHRAAAGRGRPRDVAR